MALLLGACRHVQSDSMATATASAEQATLAEGLATAEALLDEGYLEAAQAALVPLLDGEYETERVAALVETINDRLIAERQAAVAEEAAAGPAADDEFRDRLRAASRCLDETQSLVERDRLEEAAAALAPLLDGDLFVAEVKALAEEIASRRALRAAQRAQKASEARMILAGEQGFVLPDSYGKTVAIPNDLGPLTVPPGPMEELINAKVDMRLDNAGVKDLIMALGEVGGMNIIADEDLPDPKKININVKEVPLRELLSYITRNMGISFHVGASTVWVTTGAEGAAPGPQLETRIYELRGGFVPNIPDKTGGLYTDAAKAGFERVGIKPEPDTELEEALKAVMGEAPTDGSFFRIFRNRNVLIVRGTRTTLRLVEEMLQAFDKPPLQVLIEARFVTIRQSDLLRYGFTLQSLIVPAEGTVAGFSDLRDRAKDNMTLEKGQSYLQLEKTLSEALDQKRLEGSGEFPGTLQLSGILGTTTFQAVLEALKQDGRSRTLSAPRVTVANNSQAYIYRGMRRYYFQKYELETIDLGDAGTRSVRVPSGDPQELPLGLYLTVTPNIGNDMRTVILALAPEIKVFVDWETFDPEGIIKLPIVSEESLQTTVVINSGETVVLGGMITQTESEDVRKVPLLGDIPLLGRLFQRTSRSAEPSHLLIFVTARVIGPSGAFVEMAAGGPEAPGGE